MVDRVDEALREQLGLPLGLADDERPRPRPVHRHRLIPDRTSSDESSTTLSEQGGDGLVAAEAKQAALSRASTASSCCRRRSSSPTCRSGLALQRLGVPLDAASERARQRLPDQRPDGLGRSSEHRALPFPEFVAERDAAEAVKREQPILVVLGNPPYNGFAGVIGAKRAASSSPTRRA